MKSNATRELTYAEQQQRLNRRIKIETAVGVVAGLIGLFSAAMHVLTR